MSVSGMEMQIKWVKKYLNELGSSISCLDNDDIISDFESLETEIDGLIDECQETMSSIQDL